MEHNSFDQNIHHGFIGVRGLPIILALPAISPGPPILQCDFQVSTKPNFLRMGGPPIRTNKKKQMNTHVILEPCTRGGGGGGLWYYHAYCHINMQLTAENALSV